MFQTWRLLLTYPIIMHPPPNDVREAASKTYISTSSSQALRTWLVVWTDDSRSVLDFPFLVTFTNHRRHLSLGLPNPSYFPYDTLEATVATPQRFQPSNNGTTKKSGDDAKSSMRLIVPKESHATDVQNRIDIATALQYVTADGLPPMASFVRQFARHHLHPNVPYAGGPETILTTGATDGFSKSIEVFTNVWNPDRDWTSQREGILCEEFVYMNAVTTVKPRGLNVVPVAIDVQGMLARGKGGLADVLENWDFRKGRRPHLMYTIT